MCIDADNMILALRVTSQTTTVQTVHAADAQNSTLYSITVETSARPHLVSDSAKVIKLTLIHVTTLIG